MRPPVPPDFAHLYRYRVPYAEIDAMGRVYYANYLIWLERARVEMLRAAGLPYKALEAAGILLPVRDCHVRYYSPAEYDDEVELRTWLSVLRRASVTFKSTIHVDDRLAAAGTVELVCMGRDGKPKPFEADLTARLQPFLQEHGT